MARVKDTRGVAADDELLRCSNCGEFKAALNFYKNRSKLDGHDCYCKLCRPVVDEKYLKKQKRDPKKHARRLQQYRDYRLRVKLKNAPPQTPQPEAAP